MGVVDSTKRRLHRDICADPVLHGQVLNLYLKLTDTPPAEERSFAFRQGDRRPT